MKNFSQIRLPLVGACAALLLLLLWWSVRLPSLPAGSIKGLALKAAAGDTNAIAALLSHGANAVPALRDLLTYQDPFMRRQARALAPRLPKRLGDALLRRVGPPNAAGFRVAGVKSLGLLKTNAESAVPALLNCLHDPEPYMAMEAAMALSKIGGSSITGLTRALADKDPGVRHAAAYALGELGSGSERAIPELIETLADQDPTVRSSSAYSLMMIGYPAVGALSNIIDHADANAREAAVNEFTRFYLSFRKLELPLIKMAGANEAASRRRALEALGAMRAADDAAVHAFSIALRDPIPEVRLAAAKALSLIPWRAHVAINELIKSLRDPSPAVGECAARILGGLGPIARPSLEELQRCVRESDGSVQAAAREAINKIECREARGATTPLPATEP